ncbi:hypothetical protein SAMN04487989_10227 [Bizionia echini]|uniref:Uncharacterized protein n=1 Tax=Bizionia echini TaxID=649333 RepID=A0A1I5AFZ2_9FLAO|nr:hypothetical protein SAMN04487989_10227 [Bizionia echini]
METSEFSVMLVFILFFYLVSLILLNRVIIYKGFKTFALKENEIKDKLPFLLAGNLSIFISLFILIKPLVNFISYQINNKESLFYVFSVCSIVFVLNVILLLISYILSKLLITFFIKANNVLIQAILWLVISTLLIVLTNEFYNLITSTDAFNIY